MPAVAYSDAQFDAPVVVSAACTPQAKRPAARSHWADLQRADLQLLLVQTERELARVEQELLRRSLKQGGLLPVA